LYGGRGMHATFWLGNLNERVHLQDLSLDGRIILKWTLKKYDWWACAGLIGLRIGLYDRMLETWQ